ncbi:MAG: PilZ domain-containing protein [Myxococcales bacterium]
MNEPNGYPNKRRFPRLAVAVKVEGFWWDLEGGRRKLNALMTMVSEGGVQLRSSEPIPANARVEFAVKLGTLRKFDVKGLVRWWRRNGEIRDLGVEFEEPVRRLGAFVEKELVPGAIKSESAA